ncbi:DUF1289 domain-containing protein [Rheinheimera maricola]|uniref:DUF1289 domain-containing protein n=1 Tax=Rheinheimera maricola TaxID=2793282 RepID=A0ABS7X7B8_9GAMM|nr:DUF1289 domain-containing protein [Rheinheimera maricola]MBZ9611060.1 DUF1289 domain-containing protein [Rheinheimera maricola]
MVESPCVACCRLNADKVCVGCFRHITEIVDWNKRTDSENYAILQKLAKRKQDADLQQLRDTETSPITQAEWLAAKLQARKD